MLKVFHRITYKIVSWHISRLKLYLLRTKCITSGIITGLGDICAQYSVFAYNANFEQEENLPRNSDKTELFQLDTQRTAHFAMLGSLVLVPSPYF